MLCLLPVPRLLYLKKKKGGGVGCEVESESTHFSVEVWFSGCEYKNKNKEKYFR